MSSVLDAVRELRRAVNSALPCAEQIPRLLEPELTAWVAALGVIARKVSATGSLVVADVEGRSARELGAAGLAQSNGVRNGPALVQKLTGSSIAEAQRLVRAGGLLETAELAAPAVDAGPGPRDLRVLAALTGPGEAPIAVAVRKALRAGLGAPRSAQFDDTWRIAALELIDEAWAAGWTVEGLQGAAGRRRAVLDARIAEADATARFEARSLKRRRLGSGNRKWDLELDPETDAALRGPLSKRLSPRLGGPRFRAEEGIERAAELEQGPRTNEQLLIDEFAGIFSSGVAAASAAGAFGKAEPHVSVVVTSEELRKAAAGRATGLAWVDGGQPVTARAALRAICTGTFTPILFDESGKAVDVGKDQRLFTVTQRRAMAVRDGGCRWPGCTRAPGEAEAHHLKPWAEGEQNHKSETEDGILLCRFHHLTLHWPGRPPVPWSSKSGVMTQLGGPAREHERLNGRMRNDG